MPFWWLAPPTQPTPSVLRRNSKDCNGPYRATTDYIIYASEKCETEVRQKLSNVGLSSKNRTGYLFSRLLILYQAHLVRHQFKFLTLSWRDLANDSLPSLSFFANVLALFFYWFSSNSFIYPLLMFYSGRLRHVWRFLLLAMYGPRPAAR